MELIFALRAAVSEVGPIFKIAIFGHLFFLNFKFEISKFL